MSQYMLLVYEEEVDPAGRPSASSSCRCSWSCTAACARPGCWWASGGSIR